MFEACFTASVFHRCVCWQMSLIVSSGPQKAPESNYCHADHFLELFRFSFIVNLYLNFLKVATCFAPGRAKLCSCNTSCPKLHVSEHRPSSVGGCWLDGWREGCFTHAPLYKESPTTDHYFFIIILILLLRSDDFTAHPAGGRALLPDRLLGSPPSGRLQHPGGERQVLVVWIHAVRLYELSGGGRNNITQAHGEACCTNEL